MSIKVGDKVRFLNDVGGGVVTKLIDRFTVLVENETGFDVPVPVKEIVVVEEAEVYIEKPKQDIVSGEQQVADAVIDLETIFYPDVVQVEESGNEINMFLAFVPQKRPGNSDLNVFLINDSNYNVLYSIINENEVGSTFSNAVGMLEANTKEQTETLGLASVNAISDYTFHLVFYKKGEFKTVDPVVKQIKINPVRFYKENAYTENDFFNEGAILLPIVSSEEKILSKLNISGKELERAIKEKERKEVKPKVVSKKEKQAEILEVDLHIHELLDDFRGLTNGEILEVQMEHFHARLNEALKKGPKKVVFIHGVGNGTLKLEVRKELDRKKTVLQYHDASFQEYGYGATMIKIK